MNRSINKSGKIILFFFTIGIFAVSSARAVTFTVDSVADTPDASVGDGLCDDGAGVCTLRAAIQEANTTVLTDRIEFAIPPLNLTVKTITPNSPLPDITQPVYIEGYSQPGARLNSSLSGENALLLIELNGANAGAGANGLRLACNGTSIAGLVINRFARNGISISGDQNAVSGNFIGTDATGMIDLGNGGNGVEGEFFSGSDGNGIGYLFNTRNIISGNGGGGVIFDATGAFNIVRGNFIGLAADGTTALGNDRTGVAFGSFTVNNVIGGENADAPALPNGAVRNFISGNGGPAILFGGSGFGGISIKGNYIGTNTNGNAARPNAGGGIATNIGNNANIGGTGAGAGNLISGNTGDGIGLGFTSGVSILGNYIGTKADGTSALPNTGDGIEIAAGGSGNQIGGTTAASGNVIAFNGEDGVQITDVGVVPVGNPILGNSIFSNGGLGINMSVDTVTPNDAGDGDAGANNLQNFPLITNAQPGVGSLRLTGTLNSTPNRTFRLEFYNSPSADASGYGEGQTFIGFLSVTTDAAGNVSFDQTFAFTAPIGSSVSATATDATTNDTSEFSGSKQVLNPSAAVVIIGGRATETSGRGLSGARISLTGADGIRREARTNAFGYYTFDGVQSGETYILTAARKGFDFGTPQVVFAGEELAEINFTGAPNF